MAPLGVANTGQALDKIPRGTNWMGTDTSDSVFVQPVARVLSGRARNVLQQHQRRVAVLEKDMQGVDRILSGALTACDGRSQQEMLSAYLEAVQELRVSLQRLEAFLLQRLVDPDSGEAVDG